MSPASLLVTIAGQVTPSAGAVALGAVILKLGPDAILRLVAGLTAIVAKDERSHAQRALDVLTALRRDGQPPGAG